MIMRFCSNMELATFKSVLLNLFCLPKIKFVFLLLLSFLSFSCVSNITWIHDRKTYTRKLPTFY